MSAGPGGGAGGFRINARRAIGVALSGLALILVAFVFDASPLFVPGVALAAIGVLSPAWVWTCARGADAQRVLSAERVVEEQPLEASIEVRRGRLGLPGAEVIDPFTGSRLDLAGPLSTLRGDRRASVRVVTHFSRRGMQTLAPPSLVVSDPLELARVQTESGAPPQKLLVLPRTEPVRWLTAAGGRRFDQPDGHASSEAQAAVDMDGLRPYRPGTPASRIHWPAVARGAGLIERRLQADGDSRPLIVLDARTAGSRRPARAAGRRRPRRRLAGARPRPPRGLRAAAARRAARHRDRPRADQLAGGLRAAGDGERWDGISRPEPRFRGGTSGRHDLRRRGAHGSAGGDAHRSRPGAGARRCSSCPISSCPAAGRAACAGGCWPPWTSAAAAAFASGSCATSSAPSRRAPSHERRRAHDPRAGAL